MMVPLLSLSMINYARPQIKSDGENIISKMWWMNYPVKYWKKCVAHYLRCRAARLCWSARWATSTTTRWCGSRGTDPSPPGMSRLWWFTPHDQILIYHDPISDKTGQQNESPTQLGGNKPQDHKTQTAGCRYNIVLSIHIKGLLNSFFPNSR